MGNAFANELGTIRQPEADSVRSLLKFVAILAGLESW
jgi:hypothetical protein